MTTVTTTKACEACAYWDSADNKTGECRRHAPVTVAFNVDAATKYEAKFPETKASDWCGDFQPGA